MGKWLHCHHFREIVRLLILLLSLLLPGLFQERLAEMEYSIEWLSPEDTQSLLRRHRKNETFRVSGRSGGSSWADRVSVSRKERSYAEEWNWRPSLLRKSYNMGKT